MENFLCKLFFSFKQAKTNKKFSSETYSSRDGGDLIVAEVQNYETLGLEQFIGYLA